MRYVDVFLCLCVATSGSGLHRVKTLALDMIKIDQMETGRHELEQQRRQSGEAAKLAPDLRQKIKDLSSRAPDLGLASRSGNAKK